MIVSSRSNERVKQVRVLRDRRGRDATGAFFAEGERVLRAALTADATIEQVVIAPERLSDGESDLAAALERRGLPVLEVTPPVFDALTLREESQAIGAVVQQRWQTLTNAGHRCWVALHDIQHPGNLGTIIRTCDAVGGDGVILSGRSTDPYHPVAVRGSLGALFSQRIVRATPDALGAWAKAGGCTVIGTSPAGSRDYREVDYRAPVVLLMGSERVGLSEEQISTCNALVRVPMAGSVESLNLSVATALVLYEVYRQQEGG